MFQMTLPGVAVDVDLFEDVIIQMTDIKPWGWLTREVSCFDVKGSIQTNVLAASHPHECTQ